MEEIIENVKLEIELKLEHFKSELGKLRTGRANVSLVENISVDYYPLKQLATISIPEPRVISVSPWDKNCLKAIEIAVIKADLGLNPNNDGQMVRLTIPALTEETRKEIVRVLNQKTEEARILIRNVREDAWKEIQEKEKNGEISEDDKFRGKERLQKVIDEYNNKVEELRKKKEKEIMTI